MAQRSLTSPITSLTQGIDVVADTLASLETRVIHEVRATLARRKEGLWDEADDDLFVPFTAYCNECWANGLSIRPPLVWAQFIAPAVAEVDDGLSKSNPPSRIHKGSPLYNVGLSHLLSGNLEGAMALFAEAGEEDILLGRTGGKTIP